MEFLEIPEALKLDLPEWSLLLGFFSFREEPRDRLSHLCHMEPADVDRHLDRLVAAGLVRSRPKAGGNWYSLAPLRDWLDRLDGGDGERRDLEIAQLRRLLELRDLPSITVVANREIRDREAMDPKVRAWAHAMLPNVDLRLGTRCNLNCVYCLLGHENRYDRPAAEVVDDLAFAREQNLEKVAFTGGEPTMHKDLPKLVRVAREKGFREVILLTNGTILPYPGRLDRLVEAGVSWLGISFDTTDRETANALWQAPMYDRVVEAFQESRRFPDLKVGSIAVVTAMNYRQLPDLARFFADLNDGMKKLFVPNLDFVMPEENAWQNRARVVPRLTDVVPHVLEALRVAGERGLTLSVRGFPPCLVPGYERLVFDRYMSIFRLVKTPDGSVFDRTSIDVLRTKGPECPRCIHYRECNGVSRSYANLHGVSELRPVLRETRA